MKCDEFVVHVVDPDRAIGDGLTALLNTYGIRVCFYPDAETFLQSWSTAHQNHCCLLVEADLPGLSGPALIQRLLDECADLPVLLLISTSPPRLIEVAQSSDRIGVIEKPLIDSTLVDKVLRMQQQA